MRWLALFFVTIFCYAERIPEKVIICGVCQCIENTLPLMLHYIDTISALFADYRVIIYENNSGDETFPILSRWARNNPKILIQHEDLAREELSKYIINNKVKGRFKPEYIARARNIVLDIAMSDRYSDFPFLLWLDMDFHKPPHYEGIVEVFESDREWDAVLAYGVLSSNGQYWDWYAHRDARYPLGPELLGPRWFNERKELHLNSTDDWYPVYSAFGGCGIYRKSSLIGCRYSGIVTEDLGKVAAQLLEHGKTSKNAHFVSYFQTVAFCLHFVEIEVPVPDLPDRLSGFPGIKLPHSPQIVWRMHQYSNQYPGVCEHVPLHASMILRGHNKIFINPRLIFIY
jgi:hypothetical protein